MKFSAIEIYNENIRDLLNSDGTSLRLRDDPEVHFKVHFFFTELLFSFKSLLVNSFFLCFMYLERDSG